MLLPATALCSISSSEHVLSFILPLGVVMRKRRQFLSNPPISDIDHTWVSGHGYGGRGWASNYSPVVYIAFSSHNMCTKLTQNQTLSRIQDGLDAVTYSTTMIYTSTVYTTISSPTYRVSRAQSATVLLDTLSPSATNLGNHSSYTWGHPVATSPDCAVSGMFTVMTTIHITSTTTIRSVRVTTLTTTVSPSDATLLSSGTSLSAQTRTRFLSGISASALPTKPSNHSPIDQGSELIAKGPISKHRAAAVAGGITGALAGLAVIALLALLLLRRRRKSVSDGQTSYEVEGTASRRTRIMNSWHAARCNHNRIGDHQTSRPTNSAVRHEGGRSTPQLPPLRHVSDMPVIDGGLIRYSTGHWNRPFSQSSHDPKTHPSLLPLPLKVTNPDRPSPEVPRVDSHASSAVSITSAECSQQLHPGLFQKNRSALGAAIMAVKRTFSSDSMPHTQDPQAETSMAAPRANILQPPPRLGQTLTMPSAVILAGGNMPPSSHASIFGNTNAMDHSSRTAPDHLAPHDGRSARSSVSGNVIVHHPPDDPFTIPAFGPGLAIPYPSPSPSPSACPQPLFAEKRPLPSPIRSQDLDKFFSTSPTRIATRAHSPSADPFPRAQETAMDKGMRTQSKRSPSRASGTFLTPQHYLSKWPHAHAHHPHAQPRSQRPHSIRSASSNDTSGDEIINAHRESSIQPTPPMETLRQPRLQQTLRNSFSASEMSGRSELTGPFDLATESLRGVSPGSSEGDGGDRSGRARWKRSWRGEGRGARAETPNWEVCMYEGT